MKPHGPPLSDLSTDEFAGSTGCSALVVAHPGHELRVYGWMRLVRPIVFVLTDGSGRSGRSRLGSTTKLGAEAGARFGRIYGRFTDIDIYKAVLDCNFQVFTILADELAAELVRDGITCVVGDALEGYNPAHDICRMLVNASVDLARRRHDHEITNFDFSLVGNPSTVGNADRTFGLKLKENIHREKLAAAAAYSELSMDVGQALETFGADAFQVEYIHRVDNSALDAGVFDGPPFYEQYGEKQVSEGHYDQVLRHRQHMVPLAEALKFHVEHWSRPQACEY